MCKHNKHVAQEYGTSEIVQCWTLAHMIALSIAGNSEGQDEDLVFQQIPFPKILLESL